MLLTLASAVESVWLFVHGVCIALVFEAKFIGPSKIIHLRIISISLGISLIRLNLTGPVIVVL